MPAKNLCLAAIAVSLFAQPQTHVVKVNADGSFSPRTLYIKSGDTVRWEQLTRADSIIRVTGDTAYPALCDRRAPFTATDPNEITGPVPFAPSGVFVMGIHGPGYVESASTCPGNLQSLASVPGKSLCLGAPYQSTMDATWKSPNNTGVFIRLLWKDVNPSAGVYDFSVLQREMEKAIKSGKLFSLSIKAGANGTPDWIFTTNVNGTARANGGGGVPRLSLQDTDEVETSCGISMDLGSPTNARYQQLYLQLMSETAKFIKSRGDWYRALAYIKTSGANLVSEENRLPKHCDSITVSGAQRPCVCNPQVFSQNGFRPSGLYAYFDALTKQLRDQFPGKAIGYSLIQDGFPLINETGGYENRDGASSDRAPLPGSFELTQTVMDNGQRSLGSLFVVAHNGVQPKPARCNFEKVHPKPVTTLEGYWPVGNGCPNRWAVREGAEGQITGYQTTNSANGVATAAELDSSFQNMFDNTDGIYFELYETLFWLGENTNNGVLPLSGKSMGSWAEDLHKRRVDPVYPKMFATGNPFPSTYSRTFTAGPQTINYIHGMKCGLGNQEFGQIIIDSQPPAVKAGGILTAGGFGGFPTVAPGSWVEVYGTNLSNTSRGWAGSDFNGASAPTALDGVSVRIGGQAAYVSYISPTQINAQVPSNVPAGVQPVTVTTAVGTSTGANVTVTAVQPGLSAPSVFNVNGRQYVVALFPDGTFVLPPAAIAGVPSRRARAGDIITFYGVGFGAVSPNVPAGQVAQQTNALAAALQFNFGSARATVSYAGLAPGAVGLYQFNVVVPAVPASDTVPVTFSVGGVNGAQTLFTAVQK